MGLEGFSAREKEWDRQMNERPPRLPDEYYGLYVTDYNYELKRFMKQYTGSNPAWDFIQYLLNHNKNWTNGKAKNTKR